MKRLLWLLALSPEERAFVSDNAAKPFDTVSLSIFADWLEDHARHEDGVRIRKMVPSDGDMLVLNAPQAQTPEHSTRLQQQMDKTLDGIQESFRDMGINLSYLGLFGEWSLEQISLRDMNKSGFYNREQVERLLNRLKRACVHEVEQVIPGTHKHLAQAAIQDTALPAFPSGE
jgi:hypothetical protein